MATQLTFDLPCLPSHDRGDFFVSNSNEMAVQFIENWKNWPLKKHVLSGPKSSGKTHLSRIWATMTDAKVVAAQDISDPETFSQTHLLIEDLHAVAGMTAQETTLFHTHNLLQQNGFHLLMTGQGSPHHWGIVLPDLASRIEGTRHVALAPPDDRLFAALLAKQFSDRQLFPAPEVLQYLMIRLERSHDAARRFVERADQVALSKKRAISRNLAKYILGEFEANSD